MLENMPDLPMDVVFTVCRKVIVDDQGNLLNIDSSSLKMKEGEGLLFYYLPT